MVPSPRRLPHAISRSLSRRRRLILGEEKEPEVNQRGLGRRRPFPQGDPRFESVYLHLRVSLSSHFCAIAGTARAAPAGSKPANNLQARIEGTLFKLAPID